MQQRKGNYIGTTTIKCGIPKLTFFFLMRGPSCLMGGPGPPRTPLISNIEFSTVVLSYQSSSGPRRVPVGSFSLPLSSFFLGICMGVLGGGGATGAPVSGILFGRIFVSSKYMLTLYIYIYIIFLSFFFLAPPWKTPLGICPICWYARLHTVDKRQCIYSTLI